jgi:two-component system response regulator HydG
VNFVKTSLVDKRLAAVLPAMQPHLTLESQLREIRLLSKMAGTSPKIREVFTLIGKMARSSSNVLLMGESGTGKEMVAVAIHERSPRNSKDFVAINCSAIPEQLLESELFGHKRGAFTGAQDARRGLFEQANGGTIFLDEIGDMPFGLQAKLLRVIQEREITPVGENKPRAIDVRIIAATHKDLAQLVAEGKFRQDLFYRLSVVPFLLPPLRERKEDIPILAKHFLEKYCVRAGVVLKQLSAGAMAKLAAQNWPGNVRELENCIERAVALSEGDVVEEGEIPDELVLRTHQEAVGIFARLMTLEALEKCYVLYVLAHTEEKKEQAAKILGINRKSLYRREVSYGLAEPGADAEKPETDFVQ